MFNDPASPEAGGGAGHDSQSMKIQAMRFLLILAAAAVLMLVVPRRASVLTLTASDAKGNTHAVSLGSHLSATDSMDHGLGELPVPPVPVEGAFDVRLLDAPGHSRGSVTGSYADLRPFIAETQVDTFLLAFQTTPDAYPLRFTFAPGDTALRDSVAVVLERGKELERIRPDNDGWSIADRGVQTALIIRYGVRFP